MSGGSGGGENFDAAASFDAPSSNSGPEDGQATEDHHHGRHSKDASRQEAEEDSSITDGGVGDAHTEAREWDDDSGPLPGDENTAGEEGE